MNLSPVDVRDREPRDHDYLLNAWYRNGMCSGTELMCPVSPLCLPWRPSSRRETEIQSSLNHSVFASFTEMTTRREIHDKCDY